MFFHTDKNADIVLEDLFNYTSCANGCTQRTQSTLCYLNQMQQCPTQIFFLCYECRSVCSMHISLCSWHERVYLLRIRCSAQRQDKGAGSYEERLLQGAFSRSERTSIANLTFKRRFYGGYHFFAQLVFGPLQQWHYGMHERRTCSCFDRVRTVGYLRKWKIHFATVFETFLAEGRRLSLSK